MYIFEVVYIKNCITQLLSMTYYSNIINLLIKINDTYILYNNLYYTY